MKLIADAGSSKIDWALLDDSGNVRRFETPGINALMLSAEELRCAFSSLPDADEIYYYGAGCVTDEVCDKVAHALPGFGNKHIFISTDLQGAGRSVFNSDAGLIAILGTGSNCGYYNGSFISRTMAALGYIVGDEGSGTAIGKAILRRVYRGSETEKRNFEDWIGLSYPQVLEKVYREPRANAFLASLVPYVNLSGLQNIVTEEFNRFFEATSLYFPETRNIAFVGGIAAAFESELHKSADKHKFNITKIEKRPLDGLITYHKNGR